MITRTNASPPISRRSARARETANRAFSHPQITQKAREHDGQLNQDGSGRAEIGTEGKDAQRSEREPKGEDQAKIGCSGIVKSTRGCSDRGIREG
jgi:hypothetical protein